MASGTVNSTLADNVVEVSFDRGESTAALSAAVADRIANREASAIKACLRQLQEEAAAINEPMAAQLMGAAVQALEESTVERT